MQIYEPSKTQAYNAALMGRRCEGVFGVKWREATYTKKAAAVTVQANLLAEH